MLYSDELLMLTRQISDSLSKPDLYLLWRRAKENIWNKYWWWWWWSWCYHLMILIMVMLNMMIMMIIVMMIIYLIKYLCITIRSNWSVQRPSILYKTILAITMYCMFILAVVEIVVVVVIIALGLLFCFCRSIMYFNCSIFLLWYSKAKSLRNIQILW